MLLYLVRHGQTDDNLRGIIQGHLDTPLNDHGRRESERLAEHLKGVAFTETWTSDLSRARETAEIVAALHEGLEVRPTEGLRERFLGSLQGRRRLAGEKLPKDVEPAFEFQARIITWFRSFLMTHTPSPADAGPVILLVCHAAYLKTLISVLTSKVFSFTVAQDLSLRGHARNTSVTRVRWSEHAGGWKGEVESWCEVGHLDGMFEKDVRAADVV